jgi:hypothetical protein
MPREGREENETIAFFACFAFFARNQSFGKKANPTAARMHTNAAT